MDKAKNVVDFYVLANRLKDVVRTGWKDWHVSRERVESIAEHIFGVQMLALAMWSEYGYDIDIKKVILMIAVHETEEILIGDLTPFQIGKQEKQKMGHEAVKKLLAPLAKGKEIEKLIFEFDERKTKEAVFAKFCDKLECDLQCRLYDEEGCVKNVKDESIYEAKDPVVEKMLETGKSWSEMWLTYWQERAGYDQNFVEVSNYALKHKIGKNEDEKRN